MFYLFIILGITIGSFYGWANYRIFHYPHTDKFYKKYFKQKQKLKIEIEKNKKRKTIEKEIDLKEVPPLNKRAEINSYIVHIACGIVGGISFYLVFNKIGSCHFLTDNLVWQDFVLMLIGILGYTGLLPRTLWFFASKPDIPGLIKK